MVEDSLINDNNLRKSARFSSARHIKSFITNFKITFTKLRVTNVNCLCIWSETEA